MTPDSCEVLQRQLQRPHALTNLTGHRTTDRIRQQNLVYTQGPQANADINHC